MIQIKRALDAWQSLRGQHIHLNQTSSFVSCKLNCSPQGVTADINAIFIFFHPSAQCNLSKMLQQTIFND